MDLEKIKADLERGKELERILEGIDWKEFEKICAYILAENGFSVKRNVRFKTERRYEIDIVARNANKILLIDCKHWSLRPGSKSQLKHAAERQLERHKEYYKIKFLDSEGGESIPFDCDIISG